MNYYLGMTRALALSLALVMGACRFSPPGPWGFTAKVHVPAFLLDSTRNTEEFTIEAAFTPEAFPATESFRAGVEASISDLDPQTGQDGSVQIEPLDLDLAGEQSLFASGRLWGEIDVNAPTAFTDACRQGDSCTLQLALTFALASGQPATAIDSTVTAGAGGEREGDEPDGAQVCLLVSRVNGDARTPVAEEECVPSGCRAVQPLTLGLLLSSIPLLRRRRP